MDVAGRSTSSTAASFVRPGRVAEAARSFVEALKDKYTSAVPASAAAAAVTFSGKVAEEVGFDKIREKQGKLSELKFAILDGMRIARAYGEGEGEGEKDERIGDERIGELCPRIAEADLSRNLFRSIAGVVQICSELPALRSLRLGGNRFQDVLRDQGLAIGGTAWHHIKHLSLEDTLMSWEEICHVARTMSMLGSLTASRNQLSLLPSVVGYDSLSTTLTVLHLEYNDFSRLADLASLTGLKNLRNLHLKGNSISSISPAPSDPSSMPVFPDKLEYVDLSYNQVQSWSFIDHLPTCFPGLTSLRFAHNPIYDDPDPGHSVSCSKTTDEAYMFTLARLAQIRSLNFSTISAMDRQNAEMFYLARIGKHLAAVPEPDEAEVIRQHGRYAELCDLYGPPVVRRTEEINPSFLEARLVTVRFVAHLATAEGGKKAAVERSVRIPRSCDVYAVKGIAGKLFDHQALALRLIWETGEWDPVAGFDDEAEEEEEEEEEEDEEVEEVEEDEDDQADPDDKHDPDPTSSQADRGAGKWVKREVELQDGPRQLGFCVDGSEVKIRVELRRDDSKAELPAGEPAQ